MPDGHSFDRRIRDTAFAGETTTAVSEMRADLVEIKVDVKHIRSQMDRWGGAVTVISACISVVVSVAVALLK